MKKTTKRRRRIRTVEQLESRVVLTGNPVELDIDSTGASDPAEFVQLGDRAIFVAEDVANGRELWETDGTLAGTQLVADINTEVLGSSAPSDLVVFNSSVIFAADDGINGRELWISDGTQAGTTLLLDIDSGSDSSSPADLVVVGDRVFFSADDGTGRELWSTDGTEAGTSQVSSIVDGGSSNPQQLTNVDGDVFFTADDGFSGRELWKSDGTTTGTVQVKDISDGVPSSSPQQLTAIGDQLYFVAETNAEGTELWVSDGTDAGTTLVRDLNSGDDDGLDATNEMVALGDSLIFVADDGTTGAELWITDGTDAGTQQLLDIQDGANGGITNAEFEVNGGDVFFAADDGSTGIELWKTDGTAGGTVLVADINDGIAGSAVGNLTTVNGSLFLSANDGDSGQELWESDGTSTGTSLVSDLANGASDSQPSELFALNELVLFSADDGSGEDAWSVDTTAVSDRPPNAVDDTATAVNGGSQTTIDVLSNDSDPEGAGLTLTEVTAGSNGGTTAIENGLVVYTPSTNFVGDDTFTYTIEDTDGNEDTGTVTVTVDDVTPGSAVFGVVYSSHDDDEEQGDNEAGIPGIEVTLTSDDTDGDVLILTTMTDNTGTYRFRDVPDGTYTLSQQRASAFGDAGGTPNEQADIVVSGDDVEVEATVQNESGLQAIYQSIVWFFAKRSSPHSNGELFREMMAIAEEDAGNDDLAARIRAGDTTTRRSSEDDGGGTDNAVPVAVADAYDAIENETLTVLVGDGVLANDTDADADDTLTGSLVDDPSNGTVAFSDDGSFTYEPDTDFTGTDTFTYTATDGTDTSSAATVTITVEADDDTTNTLPVATDDSYSVDEDSDLTVNVDDGVLDNDTDADSDDLTVSVVTSTTSGQLNLASDGSFTYSPDGDFFGTDTFTYVANDGTGDSPEATVTITVDSVNDGPTAIADTFTIDEDSTLTVTGELGVLMNDTDVDHTDLTAAIVAPPGGGTFALSADGGFTYTPPADFSGQTSFIYEVVDGDDARGQATATITVNPVNDAPVATADTFTIDEDTVLAIDAVMSLLVNDSDPEGDALTAEVVDQPSNGQLLLNSDGTFTYTPVENFAGTDTFTYIAKDATEQSAATTVAINVTAVDDEGSILLPTEFTNDPGNVAERRVGEAIVIPVTLEDPIDNDFRFQLDLDGSGIPETAAQPTINQSTGEITWTPTETGGPFEIRIIVVQSDRSADQETFLLSILPELDNSV